MPTAFVITHESDRERSEKNKGISIIALTLMRSLGRRNVSVVRVHPNHLDHSLSSKYCSAVEICPNLYDSEEDVVKFLTKIAPRYPGMKVLIPASDDCSLFLARHENELSAEFAILNPNADTMRQLRNKRLQYELAGSADVPIPETYFPEQVEEVREIAKSLEHFPYVIKPLEAQKWRLSDFSSVSNGRKAITVHTAEEMILEYERIAQYDQDIMIQEIVPGKDENLLTFLAYCSGDGKPLAYCVRRKLRQYPVDFGYCTATVSCHNVSVENQSRRLLEKCNYRGIVGIEFKYDSRTDSYKLIEINTRSVNTTGLSIGCGVDLPYIAYADTIGERETVPSDWQDGVTWVRLYQDFLAARELRRRGTLTYFGWLKSISGKRTHAILAWDDMRPFFEFYWQRARQTMRRLLGKGSRGQLKRSTAIASDT